MNESRASHDASDEHRSSRHRSSRHRSRRSSSSTTELYQCKRVLMLVKSGAFLLIVGLIATVLFSKSYVSDAADRISTLQAELNQTHELHAAQDLAFKRIEREVASLVQGRVPDLNPLTYDKVIAVEKDYVKNLVFTVTRKGGTTTYEYKVVLHNQNPTVVQPRLKILLFDRTGLQIAISNVKGVNDSVLIPDETRSIYDSFDITLEDRDPAYFMVITD